MADSQTLTGQMLGAGYALPAWAQGRLYMAQRDDDAGPVIAIGWGEALDPPLVELPRREGMLPRWDGTVSLSGYIEQLHLLEWGGLPLAVLELVGRPVPAGYRRLPPLPLPGLGDRHSERPPAETDGWPEYVYYLLADVESPLMSLAQDALVSSLRVVAVTGLGAQDAYWHELVNLPLVLDSLTLIGP